MPSAVQFRVESAFEVLQPCPDGPEFVTLEVGSIIETEDDIRSPGLAEIRLNDRPLLARVRDIENCTKRLDEPACA